MAEERRSNLLDTAKFSTQRCVTYILLAIFGAVVATVMAGSDQSERSMILQTVINLTLLAVGYWLGASKATSDQFMRSAEPKPIPEPDWPATAKPTTTPKGTP